MKAPLFAALYLVYPLSFLFPRSRRKWAFGSFRGAFNDNAKYLFIYCSEHCPDIHSVWLSKSMKTVREVRRLGLEAHFIASPSGIWHALTSKYWFFNSYTSDILFALSGGVVAVNLWHGVGLKRTEFNINHGKLAERYQQRKFREVYFHPESFRRPDWLLSSTPFQTRMFASAFRIPEERCLELGYPRNGILTCSDGERQAFIARYESELTKELLRNIESGTYTKVYIYMPTWRDSQRNVFTQSFDMPRLDAMLREKKALMLLKPHANVIVDRKEFAQLTNIALVDGTMDIYPVLPYTDVLITDYSSILYDYLLMEGKDVILYLYDYEAYLNDRDLYYPFDENVAGRRVYTFDELYRCIETGDHTLDPAERRRITAKFWGDSVSADSRQMLVDRAREGKLNRL